MPSLVEWQDTYMVGWDGSRMLSAAYFCTLYMPLGLFIVFACDNLDIWLRNVRDIEL